MVWSALALGLMGSLHCVGMCGPIALMLPVHQEPPLQKSFKIGLYHLGRIAAYGIIGLVFGIIGKGLNLFGAQQTLSIIIGIVMILMALLPQKAAHGIGILAPYLKLVGKVKSMLGKLLQKRGNDTFLTLGFLNGFLPCGLVYIALAGALAMGSAWQGSLFMALFGLGTVPLMTGAVYLGGRLKVGALQKVRKAIPVFVVIIGILFIVRGLGLGIPYVSPKMAQSNTVSSQIECHDPD